MLYPALQVPLVLLSQLVEISLNPSSLSPSRAREKGLKKALKHLPSHPGAVLHAKDAVECRRLLSTSSAHKIVCICLFMDVQHYKAKMHSPSVQETRT